MSNRFNRTTRLRYARFDLVGYSLAGEVIDVNDETVADFDDNGKVIGPKFDLNGELVKKPSITIRTDAGEEYKIRAGAELSASVGAELARLEISDLGLGDRIKITHTGTEPSENGEFEVKLYAVEIERPKAAKA